MFSVDLGLGWAGLGLGLGLGLAGLDYITGLLYQTVKQWLQEVDGHLLALCSVVPMSITPLQLRQLVNEILVGNRNYQHMMSPIKLSHLPLVLYKMVAIEKVNSMFILRQK